MQRYLEHRVGRNLCKTQDEEQKGIRTMQAIDLVLTEALRSQALLTHRRVVQSVVSEQAEDEGLWFNAATAPEGYLQAALRRLHAVIEGE